MNMPNFARAAIAATLMTVTAIASATPVPAPSQFAVNSMGFRAGSGFGINNSELAVVFTVSAMPNIFFLSEATPSATFQFGSVSFTEICINGPQSTCPGAGVETDHLEVAAEFEFSSPLTETVDSIAVTGAIKGPVDDGAEDFSIVFSPVQVDFGDTGKFTIDLTDLHFDNVNQSQDVIATITLDQADIPVIEAASDVPEPASLALLGLGLAAFGAACRRAAK